ncbi:hypothetical protein [Agaribacter flavus]|uniref:Uncharacterized protein n=1 Tax=Agaribacter flavus TaxID=1902781 RepID=A0ABV7FP44_9ALTE
MKKANFVLISILTLFSFTTLAESGASHHSGQASKHSVLASGHTIASTSVVASAVVAVPLISAGTVSVAAGNTIAKSKTVVVKTKTTNNCDTPLIITEKVITVDPAPNKINQ